MTDPYHFPPELLSLLVDTIPLLCRSKNDVILFFRGAGTPERYLAPIAEQLLTDAKSINKYQITRTLIDGLNASGDSTLRPRRELIKRVVEFEEFSTCWPDDQLKAKGLVADIRKIINVKDSFTRMKQERDAERAESIARSQAEKLAILEKKKNIEDVRIRLNALFGMGDTPQIRGKALEKVLNDLFRAYDILVKEDFKRRDPDNNKVLEQIDGVIVLDGVIHLVEMKWLKEPVGIDELSRHLVRLFSRPGADGIFISTSNYCETAIKECSHALNQKVIFLCSLHEIVMLLQREADLKELFQRKRQAAIIDKRPFLEVL